MTIDTAICHLVRAHYLRAPLTAQLRCRAVPGYTATYEQTPSKHSSSVRRSDQRLSQMRGRKWTNAVWPMTTAGSLICCGRPRPVNDSWIAALPELRSFASDSQSREFARDPMWVTRLLLNSCLQIMPILTHTAVDLRGNASASDGCYPLQR